MIKINLTPSAKKGKAPKPKAAKAAGPGLKLPPIKSTIIYIVGIVIVVLVIGILVIIQSLTMGNLNSEVKTLNAKLDELKIYVTTVDSLKNREKQLLSLIAPIKELNKNRFLMAHVLDELSTRIPEFTWLTSVDISASGMGIKGTTASNLLVADFMNRLEESPYISTVDLTVLEKKTVEKQEMMEFTLTAAVTPVIETAVDTLSGRTK